jgi:LacI family transcriptional regulator
VEAHFHEEAGGAEALEKLLRLSSPPDAVFAASDPIAIGALECALRHGLRVPKDLGVVGVGNHRYGQFLRVPLTTLDQNRLEIGRRAASMLINLIDGKSPPDPQVLLFKPNLIIRESSLRSAH